MGSRGFVWLMLAGAIPLGAQTVCGSTPVYSPCEIVYELSAADSAAHPHPYKTVEMRTEFRSPNHRTYLMRAFWDGGNRMVTRFTPTEAGEWDYRVTSNIAAYNGKMDHFTATESDSPGFVRTANVHHFAYTERNTPHLWMGDTLVRLGFVEDARFRKFADDRAAQKFTHIRGSVMGAPEDSAKVFPTPEEPDPAYFRGLDERIRYINQKGLVVDLLLAGPNNQLVKLFPNWEQRQRYVRYLTARYAPMNITWGGVEDFETYDTGRDLLKEIGLLLKNEDPYHHVRSTGTSATSAPLLEDGWMDFVTHESAADEVGAIEHQLYPAPFVNMAFSGKHAGAGAPAGTGGAAPGEFRRRLWNATMDGQYPAAAGADDAEAQAMKGWYEFFAGNRHWELEPYFDVDGARAMALEGVEYIVYIEKPGLIEIAVEKHGYDVSWLNPVTGEITELKKGFKGEHFAGEPPDRAHDWVLHLSREGHKESMLRSYKFESRPIMMQEVEVSARKVPFEVTQPADAAISVSKPAAYAVKLTRETHATRSMMYLWTADVADEAQGYRVVGTGEKGILHIPQNLARKLPAAFHVRVFGMNANGKLYSVDRTYELDK